MRLNKFIALANGLSRRKADELISEGRVSINGTTASMGAEVSSRDTVKLDDKILEPQKLQTVMLNKPVGYVCSRDGQGSKTIYDLLPDEFQNLKPVGRIDKDSSGLLLLTNDGQLAQELTHPSKQKQKVYEITLDRTLQENDLRQITNSGVSLDDGISKLILEKPGSSGKEWQIRMSEGRNRQIRRTFDALGYKVKKLHRTQMGSFKLGNLASGEITQIQD